MTEEERRRQQQGQTAPANETESDTPTIPVKLPEYTDPYKGQKDDIYKRITNRPQFEFSYDPSEDAMYDQYVQRYMSLGQQAMRDTMGQAAALTGGYGSSYGQAVGQQAYDTYLQGANDKLGEMSERAYTMARQQYDDEGDRLMTEYGMLGDMADEDYARYQDRVSQQQANYDNIAALITSAGYVPTAEELAAAGMSEEAANSLRQGWAAANPQLAYNQGKLTAEEFYQLTGTYPIGYNAPGSGGQYWDGGVWGPNKDDRPSATWTGVVDMVSQFGLEQTLKYIESNAGAISNPEEAADMAYRAVWSGRSDR